MVEFSREVEIEVDCLCGGCGEPVDATYSNRHDAILIVPCKSCMQDKYNEGTREKEDETK